MTISPIVLLTDFGYRDEYAGVLKGVILGVNPFAQILDLTHGIPPQDLVRASCVLTSSVSYFPRSSIFLVVVRKKIIVNALDGFHSLFINQTEGFSLGRADSFDKVSAGVLYCGVLYESLYNLLNYFHSLLWAGSGH